MIPFFIADDEPDIRVIYREILEEEGYDVLGEACSGEGCIEEITRMKTEPDIIIMDHRMLKMNGLEATRELLKLNPDFKIIFASADVSVKREALAAGAKVFLEKPFRMDLFLNIIQRIFD